MVRLEILEYFEEEITNPATGEKQIHQHLRPHQHVWSGIHPTLTIQEPTRLTPTMLAASICETCGLVLAEIKR